MAMQARRESLAKRVTPPNSFIKSPLTPPSTDPRPTKQVVKILRHIRRLCESGGSRSEPEWQTFRLRDSEYQDLAVLLKKEGSLWNLHKLRYDYNSTTETLVLRMTSQLHEIFLARVVQEIQKRLDTFMDAGDQPRDFAQKIRHNGSGRLDLQSGDGDDRDTIRRQPDAMFKHSAARWPGVIIEVSYSQKTKALPHLADDYILETDGSVCVVVGLDIDYKTKKGTILMWRPKYETDEHGQPSLEAAQTLNGQVFRNELGDPNLSPEAGLKLDLKDFATEELAQGVPGSFLISAAILCGFLNEAEQEEQNQGVERHLLPGTKKRRREYTPPEEVNSEDDRRLGEEVRRVQARLSADDSSYRSSSELQGEEDI